MFAVNSVHRRCVDYAKRSRIRGIFLSPCTSYTGATCRNHRHVYNTCTLNKYRVTHHVRQSTVPILFFAVFAFVPHKWGLPRVSFLSISSYRKPYLCLFCTFLYPNPIIFILLLPLYSNIASLFNYIVNISSSPNHLNLFTLIFLPFYTFHKLLVFSSLAFANPQILFSPPYGI